MSTQQNHRYRQDSYGISNTQRSIPFQTVLGQKMGQPQTLNRPQTPIKNLPATDKTNIGGTPYMYKQGPRAQQVRQVQQTQQVQQVQQPQLVQQRGYVQPVMTTINQQQPQAQYQRIQQYVDGPNPPPPQRRVEYVPYEQKYIDYVEQRQWVPVQRACTDYYQIEHIVDYVPVEKEDYVMVTEPKETVDYRVQYLPVEQKIIHITEANAKALGYNMNNKNLVFNQQKDMTHTFQGGFAIQNGTPIKYVQPNYYDQQVNEFQPRKSRSNFVTTEGYDPISNQRNIDKILSESAARGSRAQSRVIM